MWSRGVCTPEPERGGSYGEPQGCRLSGPMSSHMPASLAGNVPRLDRIRSSSDGWPRGFKAATKDSAEPPQVDPKRDESRPDGVFEQEPDSDLTRALLAAARDRRQSGRHMLRSNRLILSGACPAPASLPSTPPPSRILRFPDYTSDPGKPLVRPVRIPEPSGDPGSSTTTRASTAAASPEHVRL